VTLTGPGGVPLRATTTSSNGVFSIPSLAQFQTSAGTWTLFIYDERNLHDISSLFTPVITKE
jgi:hypothetical protein